MLKESARGGPVFQKDTWGPWQNDILGGPLRPYNSGIIGI